MNYWPIKTHQATTKKVLIVSRLVWFLDEKSVRLEGPNQIAEVKFNGQWVPICGHWFWNSDSIGASLFCQKMGFESGELKKPLRQLELPSDGLRVGKCNQGSVATEFSLAQLGSS